MVNVSRKLGLVLAALVVGVAFVGCESWSSKPGKSKATKSKSGSSIVASSKANKPKIMEQKTGTKKTSQPPKPVPKAVTHGSSTVAPPAVSSGVVLETWEIADVDLDGRGDFEEGVAAYDESTDTLFVWWEDAFDLTGNGVVDTFEGFLWISDDEVGFILDLDGLEALACVAAASSSEAFSGCIACDAAGNYEIIALDEVY